MTIPSWDQKKLKGWCVELSRTAGLHTSRIVRPGRNVLGIGCGAGHSSGLVKAAGAAALGVDTFHVMVDQAKKSFADVAYQVGGIEVTETGEANCPLIYRSLGF